MTKKSIASGEAIFQKDTPIQSLGYIASGYVEMDYGNGKLFLTQGDCIGLIDLNTFHHHCSYRALEDTVLVLIPARNIASLKQIISSNKQAVQMLIKAAVLQINHLLENHMMLHFECANLYTFFNDSYKEYISLCNKYTLPAKTLPDLEHLKPSDANSDTPTWLLDYYESANECLRSNMPDVFSSYPNMAIGTLIRISEDMYRICHLIMDLADYQSDLSHLLMNETGMDFFDLYTELLYRLLKKRIDTLSLSATISTFMIHIENSSVDNALYKERMKKHQEMLDQMQAEVEEGSASENFAQQKQADLTGSLNVILEYAGCSDEIKNTFSAAIAKYKHIIDKNSTEDSTRALRVQISSLFFQVYVAAFKKSIKDKEIPTILNMFFTFGYVDEELAGLENAAYLYSIANSFKGNETLHVYTIYEWMKAIYEGKKEPSRNEFDLDYPAYLHELKSTGKIDAAKEKLLLNDNAHKVEFELTNMFPSGNKVTFGRITTYCPVFSEHNVLKALENCLTTPDKICGAIEKIRTFDYSAFYRETLFFDEKLNLPKEMIQTEVLPDVVLTPIVGIRGVMWQEIEGKRRNSPACFLLPVFALEDVSLLMTRLTGEFRWEMCRREQGSRWNDVSIPSLTSEYCDYVQFYRKNNELSTDAKEKIKIALTKARNSFKEMFVRDYIVWVLYEGNGSPRLNKVARRILFAHCPFPENVRSKLITNPLYREVMERWLLRRQQEANRLNNIMTKLRNNGKTVPEEFEKQKAFLET